MTAVVPLRKTVVVIMVMIVSGAVVPAFVRPSMRLAMFAPVLVRAKVSVVIPAVVSMTRIVIPLVVVVGKRERSPHHVHPVVIVVIGACNKWGCEPGHEYPGTEKFCAAMFHLCLKFIVGRHTVVLGP